MAEQASPMPADRSEAFRWAMAQFNAWRRAGGPEPTVSYQMKDMPISTLCELVIAQGSEPLPHDILPLLPGFLDLTRSHLRHEQDKDQTYRGGARCLLRLTNDRKTGLRRRDELR